MWIKPKISHLTFNMRVCSSTAWILCCSVVKSILQHLSWRELMLVWMTLPLLLPKDLLLQHEMWFHRCYTSTWTRIGYYLNKVGSQPFTKLMFSDPMALERVKSSGSQEHRVYQQPVASCQCSVRHCRRFSSHLHPFEKAIQPSWYS